MSGTTIFRRITIDIPLHSSPTDRSLAGIRITVDGDQRPEPEQIPLPLSPTSAPPPSTAEEFARDWMAGKLWVPLQPALSADLYEALRKICTERNHGPGDQKKYMRAMRAQGVTTRLARYLSGTRLCQATFVFPRGVHRPDGLTLTQWLTRCVDEFRQAETKQKRGVG